MKKIFFFLVLIGFFSINSYSQFIYKIKADSVLITNDSCNAELNLENSTKDTLGFLYNKGNGRTEFRKGLIKLNDSLYIIGGDTLKINSDLYWKQGGNSFASTGKIGTLDTNHMDFYSNNIFRSRLTNSGNWLIGTTTDNGEKFRVNGNARVDSNFSARTYKSDYGYASYAPVNLWSSVNFFIRDTTKYVGQVGTANTSNRDTRDMFVSVGDSHTYSDYPVDGPGFNFNIRTGYNAATRTIFWRNGNVSVGVSAGTYRLTHKFAVAGKGLFTDTLFGLGGFLSNALKENSNLSVPASSTASIITQSQFLFAGAATIGYRVGMRGATNYSVPVNNSYTNLIIGEMTATEAASGTHSLLAGTVLKPLTITNAAATTTDAATLYIEGPPTGITPTNPATSLWVKSGNSLFSNGNIELGTAGNKLKIATGTNASVGTATLVAGTVTVSTTTVTTNSKIFVTRNTPGGTVGDLSVPSASITNGASFVINSGSASDTSSVNWWIIN